MHRFHLNLGVVSIGAALVAGCGSSSGKGGGSENTDAGSASDASPASDSSLLADTSPPFDGSTSDGAPTSTEAGPGDASASDAGEGGLPPAAVPSFIVVDQFGYRTSDAKVAVVRNPVKGFDASPFTPGTTYQLKNSTSGQVALQSAPAIFNAGATDTPSGDETWWFDFSSVTTPGTYYVLDTDHSFRSATFQIADDVYANVLVQAARSFYYQRDGIAKIATYAGQWSDDLAHAQDETCTPFGELEGGVPDSGQSLDLSGGWFNAGGDENKYSIWAATNVVELLRAYTEGTAAFSGTAGDNYNIPESGNGVPDILDEASWGLTWLGKMQLANGSVLTVVGNWADGSTTNGADPPSSDLAPCVYGPSSASATWSAAAAFAYGAIVLQPFNATLASTLKSQAISAWTWASANQNVTFDNNTPTSALNFGTYDQELDAADRLAKEVQAAVFLFELTGSATYSAVVDANYAALETSFSPSQMEPLDTLLEYAKLPGATASVASSIRSTFVSNVEGASVAGMVPTDPYRAYIASYAFTGYLGSNQPKIGQGNMFYDLIAFPVGATGSDAGALDAAVGDAGALAWNPATYASGYLHYIHGVNPLGLVYMTNMSSYGATTSLSLMFSTWFATPTSTPPPAFIVAGPNPGYDWDECCNYPMTSALACGGGYSLNLCGASPPSPPYGQPAEKSYRDFNTNWPLDSWQVSESNNAYMSQYIRLVSKFVQ